MKPSVLMRALLAFLVSVPMAACDVAGDLFGGGGRDEDTEVERMVFVRENQIHSSWLRTARLIILTDPGAFSSPVWSPDGSKVAFIELVDGQEILSTVDRNGENKRAHFFGDIGDDLLAWTPDSRQILFLSGEGGTQGPVTYTAMRIDIRTGVVDALEELDTGWTHFRWSPNGDRLFYTALAGSSWDISFLGTAAGSRGGVDPESGRDDIFPTVSPDGEAVAFISHRFGPTQLRVHSFRNGTTTTVADTRIAQRPPLWSWDSSRLAFVKEGHIWAVGADGSGLAQLTDQKANYQLEAWSPGGNEIIYRANIETDRIVQVSSEVYLFRLEERSHQQILDFGEDLDILWKHN